MATGPQNDIIDRQSEALADKRCGGMISPTSTEGMESKSSLPAESSCVSDGSPVDASRSTERPMSGFASSATEQPNSSADRSKTRPPSGEKLTSPAGDTWPLGETTTTRRQEGAAAAVAGMNSCRQSPLPSASAATTNDNVITPEPDLTFSDAMVMPREGPWYPPDVTVVVQSEKYEIHRSLLIEKCDFFRAMFTSGMRETWEGEVVLNEVSVSAFRVILGYLYTNAILLTEDNFQEVLNTAMYLQMKFTFEPESLYPIINKNNFRYFMEFAESNGLAVVTNCVELFVSDSYLELLESGCLKDVPERFLENVIQCRCKGKQVIVAIVDDIRSGASTFYYLDSDEERWKFLTTVPMNIRGGGVAVLDNYVYVTGRSGARRAQDKAYRYNPHIDEWKEIAPPTQERDIIRLVALRDCLYAVGVGGMCHNNPNIMYTMECDNSIEQYNPLTNTWTRKTPLPRRLCWLTATAHADLIFVHGKTYDVQFDVSIGTNFYYDPRADAWHEWELGAFLFSRAYSPYQYQLSMLSDGDNFYFVGCKDKHIDEIRQYDFESGRQTVKLSSAAPGPKRESGVFAACGNKIYVIHSRSETEYFIADQQKWEIIPCSALRHHGAREYPHSSFVFHRPRRVRHIATNVKPTETAQKKSPMVNQVKER